MSARRKYTESDYHQLAKDHNFVWLGDILPKNTNTRSTWKCQKGHEWQTTFQRVRLGDGCPHCRRRDAEDYKALADRRGFRWIADEIPEYAIYKTKWQCSNGHIWEARYTDINQGSGCPTCAIKKKGFSQDDYRELANQAKLTWISDKLPKNTSYKTLWRCDKGHIINRSYHIMKQAVQEGNGTCPECSKITETDYHSLARLNGFSWIGKTLPKKVIHNTLWKCKRGHTWEARYNNIKSGYGCPRCKQSSGEKEIAKILDSLGVRYERQKRFTDCVNPKTKKVLPFDFYFKLNGIEYLIEYQGIQHYQTVPNNFFGGIKELKQRQFRDEIKSKFAKDNGFFLLIVPYTVEDIKTFICSNIAYLVHYG